MEEGKVKREDIPPLRGLHPESTIPEVLYLGRTEVQWPIQAFQNEAHAVYWLKEGPDRHLYRVDMSQVEVVELELTPPVEQTLKEKQ